MQGEAVPLPERVPAIGAEFKHYKGETYRVTLLALHANDHEWMVVYEPLYEKPEAPFFTRPLGEWFEAVSWEGKEVSRFTAVEKASS